MNPDNTNPVRFDSFMQRALHDPCHGYYAKHIKTVGKTGDFSTTATLSRALGRAIAHSALQWAKTQKQPLNLIEIGGGDGSLAKTIIHSTPLIKRWKLNYHIVDSSPTLTAQQQKINSKKIHWHNNIKTALKATKGIAFIFSNELVDAFPVRILKKNNTQWLELYLNQQTEIFLPCQKNLPNSSATKSNKYKPDQRIEIHESYHQWLQEWTPHWLSGQLLTIDYGDTIDKLYYRMPRGTLRSYSNHQHITGPATYLNPGRQDITADVNFTDLINWGNTLNLKTISLTNQRDFLLPFIKDTPADHFLTHPDGAGSAFKVLLQQKLT